MMIDIIKTRVELTVAALQLSIEVMNKEHASIV